MEKFIANTITLESLCLSNSVSNSTDVYVLLAKGVNQNTTILTLDLSNNGISDAGAVALYSSGIPSQLYPGEAGLVQ